MDHDNNQCGQNRSSPSIAALWLFAHVVFILEVNKC